MAFFQPNVSQTMHEHARWAIQHNALTETEIAARLARKGYKRPLAYVRRFLDGREICASDKFIMAVVELCDEQAKAVSSGVN